MQLFSIITAVIGLIHPFGQPEPIGRADTIAIYYHTQKPAVSDVAPNEALTIDQFLSDSQGTDDLYTRSYDSLVVSMHELQAQKAFDDFFNDFINIESTPIDDAAQLPDSVYESRLRMILSPIVMPYNSVVKRYIVAYTTSRRHTMEDILGRSRYYFPMIEAELDKAGLPIELRMLAAIESALSPTAISRAGATGLWQFMYTTGKHYGLEINSFIDQRRDPVLATRAACRYLKDLYAIYGDWTLALAAYNCGPGNVNKAIRRAGTNVTSFWDIYPYLPRETRGYVPSFMAATYVYTFHFQHDLQPAEHNLPLATDTVTIRRPMHLDQVASSLDIPKEVLRSLNPQYKQDIIPATSKSYPLTLPLADITRYIDNEETILAKDTVYLAQYLRPSRTEPARQTIALDSFTYRVKSGDTLSGIAKKHHVTVAQLMKWNNLKSANRLRVGQTLEIYR